MIEYSCAGAVVVVVAFVVDVVVVGFVVDVVVAVVVLVGVIGPAEPQPSTM